MQVSGTTNTAAALCIRSEAGAKDELRCGVGLVQAHCHCQHRSAVLGDSAASRNERAPTFLASPWSLLQAHQASVSMLAIKPPRRGLTQPMSLFEFPPAEDGLSATPSFPRCCLPPPRAHSDSARGDEWRQETLFCAALPGNIPSPVNVFVLRNLQCLSSASPRMTVSPLVVSEPASALCVVFPRSCYARVCSLHYAIATDQTSFWHGSVSFLSCALYTRPLIVAESHRNALPGVHTAMILLQRSWRELIAPASRIREIITVSTQGWQLLNKFLC